MCFIKYHFEEKLRPLFCCVSRNLKFDVGLGVALLFAVQQMLIWDVTTYNYQFFLFIRGKTSLCLYSWVLIASNNESYLLRLIMLKLLSLHSGLKFVISIFESVKSSRLLWSEAWKHQLIWEPSFYSQLLLVKALPQTHFMADYLIERCGFLRENVCSPTTVLVFPIS